MNKLPISIISPVRNCANEMIGHAAQLKLLGEVAEEIIVVDSDSHDGTLDILKRELAGHDVQFLNHPPGLYQSWNYGLSKARGKYCTVATVGDILPVESLRELARTMERFTADVVISAPRMKDGGGADSLKTWPIHRFITETGITGPCPLSGALWMTLCYGFFPATLISSSAGNLYRTRVMQENPFPTEFGHAGDSAWALQMSRKLNWVIDPTVVSYFWIHPPAAGRQKGSELLAQRISAMARGVYTESEAYLREEGVPEEMLKVIGEMPEQLLSKTCLKIRYAEIRCPWMPWFLQGEAIRIRSEREALEGRIRRRRDRTLAFAREVMEAKLGSTAK